jgi:hypothetical protein
MAGDDPLLVRRSPQAQPKMVAPQHLVKYAPARRDTPRPRRRGRTVAIAGIVVLLLVAGGAWVAWTRLDVSVRLEGMADGMALKPTDAARRDIRVVVDGASGRDASLTLDGRPLPGDASGNELAVRLPALTDGLHRLDVRVDRTLRGPLHHEWTFTIDGTPPVINLPRLTPPVPISEPFSIDGHLDAPASVVIDGAQVTTSGTSFHAAFSRPPAAPVTVNATDAAGNVTTMEMTVPVVRPPTHAVHVTSNVWGDPSLRAGVLALVASHAIDAVELDLKDESGVVGYDTKVPLAQEIGAAQPHYKIADAVAELHQDGVRVIGRIVAFRDPILATKAWEMGHTDWVVQTPNGRPLGAYGGFTNPASTDVQAYNIAIATEAARAGFDEILWDYVRRPEGPIDSMVFPGSNGNIANAVVGFLASSHSQLRALGVLQGASVFGIAATRPDQIAQDIPAIARHVDYIAPMVYPSHWNKGEYGIADPNRQPYDIVKASLRDFQHDMAGSGRALTPWLQDFSEGVTYGPNEVQAQVKAATELGDTDWLLWNPSVVYTPPFVAATR